MVDWLALRACLWPVQPDSSPGRPVRSWRRWALAIPVWWPILYVLFVLGCYAGAVIFRVFGWSPTAGFNVAGLAAGITLGIWYLVVAGI